MRDDPETVFKVTISAFIYFFFLTFFFFLSPLSNVHPSPDRHSDRIYIYEVRTSALRTQFDKHWWIFDLSFTRKKNTCSKQLSCQTYLEQRRVAWIIVKFIVVHGYNIIYGHVISCISYTCTINNVHYSFKNLYFSLTKIIE